MRLCLVFSSLYRGFRCLFLDWQGLANIDRIYASPRHGIEFIATKGVTEGMELLIDYGKQWNLNNSHKLEWLAKRKKKDARKKKEGVTSETYHKEGFVEGIHRKVGSTR